MAETKSHKDVQESLAVLLAKEVEAPGKIGLSTLYTSAALTPEVARVFERFCGLSIDDKKDVYFIHPRRMVLQQIGPLDEFGISYSDLDALYDAGLIRSVEARTLNFVSDDPKEFDRIDYGGRPALFNFHERQLDIIYFTKPGRDLRRSMELARNAPHQAALEGKFGVNFVANPS